MHSNNFGKTIKLFLLDADPEGRVICELSNWTGKAFRIPRGKVKDCANREDLKTTGVYLLFGKADTSTGKPRVYVGEAENAFERLKTHVSKKEFWNEAVVFFSKDENLNKAHIKYLESRLYEMAVKAGRYELENDVTPTRSAISESDTAELEEFMAYVKVLLSSLGFKPFEPLVKSGLPDAAAGQVAEIECLHLSGRDVKATGQRVADGFVVFAGSQVTSHTVPSLPKGVVNLRSELIDAGVIVEERGRFRFAKDYLFGSPSGAAVVILGRSANGLEKWKNASGKSLKELEENMVEPSE